MIKSSILKKVIPAILVLTTVCIFSAGVCFAKDNDPDKAPNASKSGEQRDTKENSPTQNPPNAPRIPSKPLNSEDDPEYRWYADEALPPEFFQEGNNLNLENLGEPGPSKDSV